MNVRLAQIANRLSILVFHLSVACLVALLVLKNSQLLAQSADELETVSPNLGPLKTTITHSVLVDKDAFE